MQEIFINGRFYSQKITGVQRYSRELIITLDDIIPDLAPQTRLTCLIPKDAADLPALQNIRFRKVGMLTGNLWEQIELPFYARKGLLFSPANTGPGFSGPQVVTLHDASVYAFGEAYSALFKLKYKILYSRFAGTACRIFTDSEFSKAELVKYCKVDPAKIVVIPLGYEHLLRIKPDFTILEKFSLEPQNYLLSVGSASPHKNFKVIVEALNLIPDWDKNLVVTGGAFEKVFSAKEMSFPEHIIRTGYITDEELAALYQNAAAVIVPSLYEGFGLPILEGLAFGCPVISSTAASLPEVGGDVVTYFDPTDPAALAEILQTSKFFYDKEKIQAQLNSFKWVNSASAVLQELLQLL